MRRLAAAPVVGFLLLLVLPAPGAAQDYYGDIRPILTAHCVQCHWEDGPAWSMEDPEEAYRMRHAIAQAVLDRRMPPWLAEGGHRAYHDDPSLSDYVLALVRDWREEGFPRGEPRPDDVPNGADATRGANHHHGAGPFEPHLSLDILPGGSYLPNQTRADDYRCFVVDWTESDPTFITGFRAVPGNLRVAHHVVIYAVAPGMGERFRELEGEEEGAGYQCFGGALPDRLGDREVRAAYEARYPDGVRELDRSAFWLSHWAPGMDGHQFPQGTGIRMEPGSALVVQMHYYGAQAPGERDAGTRMDFQVASRVERPAFHLAQTWGPWLAGAQNGSMVIPPGERATYEMADDLGDLVNYIARITGVEADDIQALEVHSANLHMHAIGESGVITLTDRNGRKEVLLEVPRWDLRWQRDFTFVEPRTFSREELQGTRIGVECTFWNPGTETVYGGFGSYDEMCFNFSYIAVRTSAG